MAKTKSTKTENFSLPESFIKKFKAFYYRYPLKEKKYKFHVPLKELELALKYPCDNEDPLNEHQKELVLSFTGGLWDMRRLRNLLISRGLADSQECDRLEWQDICVRLEPNKNAKGYWHSEDLTDTKQNSGKAGKGRKKRYVRPSNLISSKEIVNDHKVPRTTLQTWQENDSITPKKDPQTQENLYLRKWFDKKIQTYKPRHKKNK